MAVLKAVSIGDVLGNGALILDIKGVAPHGRVILAKMDDHYSTYRLDSDGLCYTGRHFETELEARQDFEDRTAF
jgi:hypothetical protein